MPKIKRTPKEHKEPNFRLAISLEDLDRIDPIQRQKMLYHRLDLESPFKPAANSTDTAVKFTCRLENAAIICDIIRSEDRKGGDSPTRIYLQCGEGPWQKTSRDAVFSVQVKGVWRLNPKLFRITIELEPPEREVLVF